MDTLIRLLDGLSAWHWWALVVVLLVLEVLTGTTYLLWPAAAAAIVGLLAAAPLPFDWELQLATFAVLTIVLTLLGDRFVSKRWLRTERPALNDRAQQLAGQKVVATADFIAGRGRVKLGDSVWAAMADGDVAQGAVLEIVGVEGSTLIVRPSAG